MWRTSPFKAKLQNEEVFDMFKHETVYYHVPALREESSQTNVILEYKLLAAILSTVCSVIQQS